MCFTVLLLYLVLRNYLQLNMFNIQSLLKKVLQLLCNNFTMNIKKATQLFCMNLFKHIVTLRIDFDILDIFSYIIRR